MTVIVLGAGVVGMATAYALQRGGARVLVLDRQPEPGRETSAANGSLLHPSLVEPWNAPGVLGVLLRSLGREDSAVLLRPAVLPSLLGWGVRFLRESSPERFRRNALKNLRLAQFSLACMAELRETTAIDYHAYRRGSLALFRERAALSAALRWYDELAGHGLVVERLDADGLIAREPALGPVRGAIAGGVYAPADEAGDPAAFCRGLHERLRAQGVGFRFDCSVARLHAAGGCVRAVELAGGERLDADAVVIAAANESVALARGAGLELPIRPAKGYSLTLPRGESGTAPTLPLVDAALHMGVVPVGTDRIRVTGAAELAGMDTRLRPERIAYLKRLLAKTYPRYAASLGEIDCRPWAGLRPVCADGVPIVGRSPVAGLWLNTGHGHIGWTTAAGSGRLLADLLLGRAPALDAGEYSLDRFR